MGEVEKQRMDAVIVDRGGVPSAGSCATSRPESRSCCGHDGIRVTPEFRERDRLGFAFMSNDVSSERRVEGSVPRIAQMMREVKKSGGRIAVVAGPVVVHTGGVEHFSELIRRATSTSCSPATRWPCTTSSSRSRARRSASIWSRAPGRTGPPQSHGGHQHHQSRRQHPRGRSKRES
jgi:hypothetical protein